MATLKQLFKKKKKLTQQAHRVGKELDRMVAEKWGFNFSETADDPIIDTLDYGTNSISFKEFEARMNEYKKQLDEDGEFSCIP